MTVGAIFVMPNQLQKHLVSLKSNLIVKSKRDIVGKDDEYCVSQYEDPRYSDFDYWKMPEHVQKVTTAKQTPKRPKTKWQKEKSQHKRVRGFDQHDMEILNTKTDGLFISVASITSVNSVTFVNLNFLRK